MSGQIDSSEPWQITHGGHIQGGCIEAGCVEAGCVEGGDSPAFTLAAPQKPPLPVILAVPHSGRNYPADLTAQMRNAEFSQVRLEDRYVDVLATAIARETGAPLLMAHAPRAMIDLNRATEDMDWSMVEGGAAQNAPDGAGKSLANRRSRSGLGLVPRRLANLGEIWRGPMSRDDLDSRIENIHRPYHITLARALEGIRDRWGAALLLDIHSMPPLKAKHAGDQPAEFVIGDRFGTSCDGMLPARAFRYFGTLDRRTAHNRPYAGGYVLDRHASPVRGIHAMQLEVCRSTYLDSRMTQPSARAATVAKMLAGLVRELADETAAMGRDCQRPLAAE